MQAGRRSGMAAGLGAEGQRISIDNEDETGVAEGATLRFMDIPILPISGDQLSLSSKRKSGFLTPIIGLGNVNGVGSPQPLLPEPGAKPR